MLDGLRAVCYSEISMKKMVLACLCLLCGCSGFLVQKETLQSRVQTQRQEPYYLTTDPEKVEDTCPRHDILKQYNCSAEDRSGATCFDVYMVQGRPVREENYTLLQEEIVQQQMPSQPACPAEVTDCASFLKALDYNLEFSWYLVNFPTSSFEQCRETYDCKRIDCSLATETTTEQTNESTLISCVYKKNQLFFVGSEITCQKQAR